MDDEDEDVYRPAPRKPKNLGKRESLPTFESSIDKFITDAKAEPHKHDVTYFNKERRETELAKEIEDLKQQLAKAETDAKAAREEADEARKQADKARADTRATIVEAEPPPAPQRGWGGIVAGFAVGALCMFGVTRLIKTDSPAAAPQQAQTTPAPAAPSPEPAPQPVDKAIDKPVEPPVEPRPADPKPVDTVAGVTKPAVKRPPITQRPVATKPADPRPADPKPADPKPADPKPADPGLYNPF